MTIKKKSVGLRSKKVLECTGQVTAFQKKHIKQLRQRVIENQEPFAIVNADTPHEIFHVMDIPIVTNQWWSAYISAKQLSPHYFAVMEQEGFSGSFCRYCSLGLACTLDNNPEQAPWGGLPKPTVLVARLTCDCAQRVFSAWAEAFDAPFFTLEAPGWTHKDTRWWENTRHNWEEVYQSKRIDLMVEEMKSLIRFLEMKTGRIFDDHKLLALNEQINLQEGTMAEASDLITETTPCPVNIMEQIPNVMIPQWHRGSEWAVSHAFKFRDEVKGRVAQGLGTCENEKIRMMWIGAGLWHDPGFYNSLEEQFGAVFVWTLYLPFAGPAYIRENFDDPLRVLASRIAGLNEVLHLPPWMNEWMVYEAKKAKIDTVLMLLPLGSKHSVSGLLLTKKALEDAGIPVIDIWADMVDATDWNHKAMVDHVSNFLKRQFGT